MIIVDTSILIPAYRRKDSPEKRELERLVDQGEAAIVGIVLTEILCGARDDVEFREMSDELRGLEYLDDSDETWILAARILRELRSRGETIPVPDALIAAHALVGQHAVYSNDGHFRRVPGLKMHEAKP